MATTGSARRPATKGRRRFFNYPRRGKGPVRRWVPSWRIVVGTFLGFFALGAGALVAAYATTEVPTERLGNISDQTTTIYYSDGVTPIATIANERRVKVAFADLPEFVGNAVVASEDETFWTNSGISPRGLARALWTNLTNPGSRQGASTITQQYIERTRTDSVTTYTGKIREMIMAVKVTRSMPKEQIKEQILEDYLNTIYWGRNVNGIEAAAQTYFGKSAKDLTISEAALLSGIIPAPNAYDPDVNESRARARWTRVMNRMLEFGFITQAERDEGAFPEHFLPRPPASNSLAGQAGYLVNLVESELADTDQFRDNPDHIRTRGLRIITTIDKNLQDTAVAVAESAKQGENPAAEGLSVGLVSMDPATGALRAIYGGSDYVTAPWNFATQGAVQAGSTFKPFTLLAALEAGHELNERFDGNSEIPTPGWGDGTGPQNFGGQNFGNIDLTKATANSVNSVYATLNIEIGPEKTVDVAHRLGIPESRVIEPVPSNVLGTASVSPLELATAYATLAGGGYRVTPHIVSEVWGLDDSLILTAPMDRVKEFDPEDIKATTYAMTHVITDGSGSTAQELGRPVAGKTGTSQRNVSAWFAGFVPQLVTVVGLHEEADGNEQSITPFGEWTNSRNGITGSTFPARAWTDFMKVALDGVDVQEFPTYLPPRPLTAPTPTPEPTPEVPTDEPTPEVVDPQAGWVDVPSGLTGRQINDVTRQIEGLGLRVAMAAEASDRPKGAVIAVRPGEGERVPPGSTITVTVSSGPGNAGGNDGGGDNGNDGGGDNGNDGGGDQSTPTPTPTPSPEVSPSPDVGAGQSGQGGTGNDGRA